jgi:hypothetical protein
MISLVPTPLPIPKHCPGGAVAPLVTSRVALAEGGTFVRPISFLELVLPSSLAASGSRNKENSVKKRLLAASVLALLSVPLAAHAQIAEGAREGAHQGRHVGHRVLGPVGGAVGTFVGGVTGGVIGGAEGAVGIRPYRHRYYHHYRRDY